MTKWEYFTPYANLKDRWGSYCWPLTDTDTQKVTLISNTSCMAGFVISVAMVLFQFFSEDYPLCSEPNLSLGRVGEMQIALRKICMCLLLRFPFSSCFSLEFCWRSGLPDAPVSLKQISLISANLFDHLEYLKKDALCLCISKMKWQCLCLCDIGDLLILTSLYICTEARWCGELCFTCGLC